MERGALGTSRSPPLSALCRSVVLLSGGQVGKPELSLPLCRFQRTLPSPAGAAREPRVSGGFATAGCVAGRALAANEVRLLMARSPCSQGTDFSEEFAKIFSESLPLSAGCQVGLLRVLLQGEKPSCFPLLHLGIVPYALFRDLARGREGLRRPG